MSDVKRFIDAVHPYVMRHGWQDGHREYYRTHPSGELKGADLNLFSSRQGVWKLLLPEDFASDLFIADVSLGAVPLDLSRSYRRVIVYPWYERSADIVRKRVQDAGVSNIIICERADSRELNRLDCRIGTSVMVITRDMLSLWGEKGVMDRVSDIVRALKRSCGPAWTSVFLFPKNHGMSPLMKLLSLIHPQGLSMFTLKKACAKHGLANMRIYHLRHAPERISEIHPESLSAAPGNHCGSGDVGARKGMTPVQRIVRTLKRSPAAYPSQMLAMSRREGSSTWLQGFLSHLGGLNGEGRGLSVRKYIAGKPNMILLEIGTDSGFSSICRMPLGRGVMTARRAENNYAALQRLQSCRSISQLAPRPLGRGVYQRQEYYVETFLSGRKLVLNPVNHAHVYAMIRPALFSLYLDAGRDTVIDEAVFRRLAGESLGVLRSKAWSRYDAEKIQALEHALKRALLGARVRLPLVHGDFKIENLLFGPGRLEGILDWDLSKFQGPPYLDLLYLYSYSFHHRPMTNGRGIMDFIHRRLVVGDLGPVLQPWWDDYSSSLKIPALWSRISGVLFWLHYVAGTIGMAMSSYDVAAYERNIRAPLEAALEGALRW